VTVRHPSGTRYLPRTIEHGRARDVPGGARATRAEAERALEIALAITRPCGVPTFVDRATYLDAAGALGLTTEFTWDAFLALDGVPFEEASRVPAQLAEIEDAMQAQPGLSSTRMVSGLDTLFDIVDLRVKNLRVPILLVVFQIGAVTLAVLLGWARSRSRARRSSSRCCTAAASPPHPARGAGRAGAALRGGRVPARTAAGSRARQARRTVQR
jgi:hypothetical protein